MKRKVFNKIKNGILNIIINEKKKKSEKYIEIKQQLKTIY